MASTGGVALDKVIINIESKVGNTHSNINKLARSLETLKASVKGGFNNLSKLATGLGELNKASKKLSQTAKNIDSVSGIAKVLNSLNAVGDPKNFKTMVNSLEKLPTVFNNINPQSLENVKRVSSELAQSLSPLSDKLASIGNGFTSLSTLAKTYGIAITKVGNDTRRASREMSTLSKTVKVIRTVLKGAGSVATSAGNAIHNSFKKMNSQIKQVALSLLGTRTLFTMVRKAAAEYGAMDKQLTDATTNLWRALGAQLAPAIEYVLYIFTQAVRVIYSVIKALTGIDLIARANAKAMVSFSKSTKNALGNLQKFDDLNVVDFGDDGKDVPQIKLDEIDLSPIQKVIDWMKKLKATVENAWKNGGWNDVAKVLAEGINGATKYIDPVALGDAIGKGILGGLQFIKTFISETNWGELGQKLGDTIRNIPWREIWGTVFDTLIEVFKGFTDFADGLFGFDGAGNLIVTFVAIEKIIKGIVTLTPTGIFSNMFGDADNVVGKIKNVGQAFSLMSKNTLTTESISGITGVSKGVLNLMKPLSNVFGLITKGVSGLGLGPMVGIVAAVVVGIMALVKAFKNLYENSEPFRKTVYSLMDGIKGTFLSVLESLKEILLQLWDVLKVAWNEVLVPIFNLIVDIFEAVLPSVMSILDVLWNNVLSPIIEGLVKILRPILGVIIDVIKALVSIIGVVIDAIKWLWDYLLEPLVKFLLDIVVGAIKVLGAAVEFVINFILGIFISLVDGLAAIWAQIKAGFTAAYNFIKKSFVDPILKAWESIVNGLTKAWENIKSSFKNGINSVIGFLNSMINKLNGYLTITIHPDVAKVLNAVGVKVDSGKYSLFKIPNIPKLETGTNEIPYEGVYHLHQGEAVVPKKYNPALANGTDEEVGQKLDALISIMNNMNFTNVVNIGNKTLYKEQQRYNKMQNDKYGTTVNL